MALTSVRDHGQRIKNDRAVNGGEKKILNEDNEFEKLQWQGLNVANTRQ
jgi:hypothetical protein